MTSEVDFTAIKAGDHVVLEYTGITQKDLRIELVSKVTSTQIVLASNAGVGRMGRYRRMDGRPIGGGYLWAWITGIATPRQIAVYQAEQAAKDKERQDARKRQEAIDAKERQLASLFSKPFLASVRTDGDKFTVEFTLTAAQVRRLAGVLHGGE